MEGFIPTYSLNNDGNGGGWGDALSAFAGAAFGSWFGNGFMGGNGGFGGGRGGYGGGNAATGPAVVVMGDGGSSTAEMDALSGIQASVNGLGLAVVRGQGDASLATAQGFASLTNANNQGFNGIYNAITTGNAANQQTLCQGFNGIQQAISDCCCSTKQTIMAEGSATRELISRYAYEGLQEKLCDAKAENAALKSQSFIAGSQAAQSAEFRAALNQQAQHFGSLLASYRLGRIDQRDGLGAAAATPTA